jgi:hypothetical protein
MALALAFELTDYVYIIPIFFLVDIITTYLFMRRYRKHFPLDTEWAENEANPIAKFFWRLYGLEHGTIITGITVLPVIIAMTYLCSLFEFMFGFVVGIYYFVFYLNFQAQKTLSKRVKRRNEKEKLQGQQGVKDVPSGTHTQ